MFGFIIGVSSSQKIPPNNRMQPNAYRPVFQAYLASCWPGIG
jgi:hypothetical protein